MNTYLGRDQILAANDFELSDVEVSEWAQRPGETAYVRVRPLTARQRSQIEGQMAQIHVSKKGYDKLGESALRIVTWCVVDDQGQPEFTERDVNQLATKNSAPILRIVDKVREISGMDKGAAEEAEEDFTDSPGSLSSTD